MDEIEELSWMVVPERHPVLAKDGAQVGYAAAVLGDQGNGRFDGIVVGLDVSMKRDPRLMLEVDQIERLGTDGVHTLLSAAEIEDLPEYTPDAVWRASKKGRLDRAIETDGSSAWDRDR